ncbi:MAG: hypothetical protein QXU44_05240, partial [Candidatus Caldarchaeum sp.]
LAKNDSVTPMINIAVTTASIVPFMTLATSGSDAASPLFPKLNLSWWLEKCGMYIMAQGFCL